MTNATEFTVVVARKHKIADDAVSLTLLSTGPPLPEWAPGAHIDVVLPSKKERQYSLCGDPANRDEWQLGVLREEAGRGGSAFVCDELAEGTVLTVRGPRNNFPLVPATRYLFIAGGIGITPILPMLRAATSTGRPWELWYGGRRRSSMGFTDELAPYGDHVHLWPQNERGLLAGRRAPRDSGGRHARLLLRPAAAAGSRRATLRELAGRCAAPRAVRSGEAVARPRRTIRGRAGALAEDARCARRHVDPARRRGHRRRRPIVVPRGHLRHLRDRGARRCARPSRLRAHRGGARRM